MWFARKKFYLKITKTSPWESESEWKLLLDTAKQRNCFSRSWTLTTPVLRFAYPASRQIPWPIETGSAKITLITVVGFGSDDNVQSWDNSRVTINEKAENQLCKAKAQNNFFFVILLSEHRNGGENISINWEWKRRRQEIRHVVLTTCN